MPTGVPPTSTVKKLDEQVKKQRSKAKGQSVDAIPPSQESIISNISTGPIQLSLNSSLNMSTETSESPAVNLLRERLTRDGTQILAKVGEQEDKGLVGESVEASRSGVN